jgi:predicted Zn-dependent protease
MPSSLRIRWLFLALTLAGCAVNPVTGERELSLISEGQEIQMGRDAAQSTRQSIGLVDNAALQEYVGRVGSTLASGSERPDLPWEFHVVDDPTPNAFALPGGFIFVTRGMMNLMDSEAELAAVLGHEIGHVTARHSVTQISRAQLAQLGLGIGMAVAPALQRLGDLANAGLNLLFLKYGRDDERQADALGFRYMAQNGYDVREMDDVFVALERSSELSGSSPLPSWLASHPSEPERIETARRRAAALQPPQQSPRIARAAYLRQIDGLVYGDDPREGFFRNGYFYHPALRLQFQVPQAWKTQNTKSAVAATSPEGDAALQLAAVDQPSIETADRAFLAQEGIEAGGSRGLSLHGDSAIVSEFAAQTDRGAVHGFAAHIAHRQAIYRLVVYATADRFPAYEPMLNDVIASFGPVTDPDVIDVEPNRLRIVTLDRDMTLAEFARRYPSAVSVEELAVLNQVEGAGAALKAGTPVKRVVGP